MVADGRTLPPSSYTTRGGGRRAEDVVSPALVYARYSEGATIVVEGLHRYWPPLTDFCRGLELALGHRLQVNAYVTPPGARGFDVHRDDHDVFVLQISGTKHWLVYDRDEPERVVVDRPLERGACLYVPEGFPHAARTTHDASAHLTVGVLTHEAIDVVRAVADLAADEPAFRARLPAAASSDAGALRAEVEHHVAELRAWLDKVDVDELTARVARRVMSSAQPLLRGQLRRLHALDAIDAATTVRRRPGASCVLLPAPGVVRVLLADRELEMPPVAAVAMEHVARNDRFRVGDLHSFLDADSALVLVRRLVREGLLEAVVG
ncbi:MAG TPA: cupin domain-containing protein [Actinomycetota bacterium]|nr:cupin domain-containing protein [Actinomycetota bacterium]